MHPDHRGPFSRALYGVTVELGHADVVILGGGILGLATAWKLSQRHPDLAIRVVEKESRLALHQTGRNSGVLHSGIYYAPGSAKARTCRRGQQEMIDFCRAHDVPVQMLGKVIVATSPDEIPRLDALADRAAANGVTAHRVGPAGLRDIEPHAAGIDALHVPGAGITDYRAVCERLAELLIGCGVEIDFDTTVLTLDDDGDRVHATTSRGAITARQVIVCAGLHSDRLARTIDPSTTERIMPFRGEYFELTKERRHLVNGLIYPVPDPAFPFLGVHLTRMIDGAIHAGPNAVPALSREGYRWRDISARDTAELLSNPGAWRLARSYWKTGLAEIVRSASKRRFVAALQRLVPAVQTEDLVRSPAGVRAQAISRDGRLIDDFAFAGRGNVLNVLNAPSPAATASLALADEIVDRAMPVFDES